MQKLQKRRMKCNFFLILLLYTPLTTAQYIPDDWKSRDKWMKIDDFLNITKVSTGYAVADVGCHEGYLTMHLAQQVGTKGKVYAVDVNNYRLEKLKKHATKRKLQNITTILGDYDDPKLPSNTLDMVYVVDTYHEMTDYKEMLAHFYKSLKPEGTIVLLEKIKKHKTGKSRSEQVSAHTLSMHYVKKELQEAGFKIQYALENFGYWERDRTKKIWVLLATK